MRQTVFPEEILVLDDGSTDETLSVLESYGPAVRILRQENRGVAAARNTLCEHATGDLIAFLDHDDIWHPRYLEVQRCLFEIYSEAVAFVTGHIDFRGYGHYLWNDEPVDLRSKAQVIGPEEFLEKYNATTGHFGSMSFCCIPREVLVRLKPEPFCVAATGADDFYLFNTLPLLGPVVYNAVPLVAYRVVSDAQSANRLAIFRQSVHAFEALEKSYLEVAGPVLLKKFQLAFASMRRQYAKCLMGAGETGPAREQLRASLNDSANPGSLAKSLLLLLVTYLPPFGQPAWPSGYRA